jgi:cellulose synthase/poly-beta-1,6-N-acetylglucosamine synthase-like glycosyltransferase
VTFVLTIVAIVVALPGLMTALHLFTLALASLAYRPPRAAGDAQPVRFLVLVPAHNEEACIGRTLASIRTSARERDTILVVADCCTDGTAKLARAAGALVVERHDDPGRAQARQAGLDRARDLEWDAVLMVDADSILEPGFMDACEQALAGGAEAGQARSEAARGHRAIDQATLAAFALQGITIPRGRDRLGLLVRLRGTGMVIRRDVVERHRFSGAASEDLRYSLDLCLDGVHPVHIETARLRSENAPNWGAAAQQKERYEAGRTAAARDYLPALLRRHDRASLEAAWFLASPPFATAILSLIAGLGIGLLAHSALPIVLTAVGLGALALALVIALIESGASARTWAALLIAPFYLAWKLVVQVRASLGVLGRKQSYGATPRRASAHEEESKVQS